MNRDIYIYGNLDFSGKSAAAKRMMYYAKALADDNHKVYLLNCAYDKIVPQNFDEVDSAIYLHQTSRPTSSIYGSLLFLKRLNSFSKKSNSSPVFIFYPQRHFSIFFWSLIYLLFIKKSKVFYELNEVKKHYIFLYKSTSSSLFKAYVKGFIHRVQFNLMDRLMKYFSGLICISSNIESYGSRFNKNTLIIPILTDPKLQIQTNSEIYATADNFNIGFSGSIIPGKENLLEFVNVLNKVLDRGINLKFNLCGTVTKGNLKLLEDSCCRENTINYYGNLDEVELSTFLKQQDLLVVPRGFTLQNHYGFSTKLSDYLNHQKVVLITDISDNGLYINDGVNGFIVEPDNPTMMFDKLIYIIENFDALEDSIIANAFETSRKSFDFRLYKKELQSFLKSGN